MSCSGYIYGASQVAAGEKAVVGFSIADALQTLAVLITLWPHFQTQAFHLP